MKLKRSEAEIIRSVKDLLKARGILSFRMWSGNRFGSYKGKRWKIEGHPAGTADILCLITVHDFMMNGGDRTEVLWIECKSSTGKQSPEQKQFQEMVERDGHSYIVARSASDIENWLKENT